MPGFADTDDAAGAVPRRLFFYNAGFLRQPRLKRILSLAGHDLCLGLPGPQDAVAVWGRSPYAARGEGVAARRKVPLIRLEDAFLRSIRPGRMGDAPLGLLIDAQGVHFDSHTPSTLERLLTTHRLDDSNLLARARDGMLRLQQAHLSKYNLHDPDLAAPAPGYVLVIDQTLGDASIRHSGAKASTFREMLVFAQEENPGARIVIKTHPETVQGLRAGHYGPDDLRPHIRFCTDPVSPWRLLEGAVAVYTVSSQLGFEAVLMGHRPRVFGQPFYAGWGLTADENPVPRRTRRLTRAQLFAGAMILAPTWYDPCRDRLCTFEQATDQLEAEARIWREDRFGHIAVGMRMWKRRRMQAVFGSEKTLHFQDDPTDAATEAAATGRSILIWANKVPADFAAPKLRRVEDGFLRSRGLGADLVPPLSLVTDDCGIYYDPTRPSRLESLIPAPLPAGGAARIMRLMEQLLAAQLSKYNLAQGTTAPIDLPQGHRILVPGQVEDDASIRLGAGAVCTNLGLLQTVRAANPDAILIYKPHPDVEAGLRPGALDASGLADHVAHHTDPIALLDHVDAVWTMTSLLGFEALLRGKPVTTLGAPFYAGWGLTRDLGRDANGHSVIPERRLRAPDGHPLPRVTLPQLAYATLIAYPRYYDPTSRRPCPAEVVVERLITDALPHPGRWNRLLAKAQGALASRAHLWR